MNTIVIDGKLPPGVGAMEKTVQAVKHPSVDVVTQNCHTFDTTADNTLYQYSKENSNVCIFIVYHISQYEVPRF